jgi:hypothetical protein
MMSENAAKVKVSARLLAELLELPEGTTIYDIERGEFGTFVFTCLHDDLPKVPEGASPRYVSMRVTDGKAKWGEPYDE